MKSNFKLVAVIAAGISFPAFSQLPKVKIDKPKVNIDVPAVGNGSNKSNGGGASSIGLGGKDASGLFSNITDDTNADYHRKSAVTNLTTLENEYKKTTIDYEALSKLIFENERTLGHIKKLEPNVDRSKYDEKYLPLKTRADKEIAAYQEAVKLEKLFESEFNATTEMKKPEVMSFRKDSYSSHVQCYCRNYRDEVKTLDEFNTAKAQYEQLTAQLVGYTDESTQKIFANMNTCIQNGNSYAIWAAKENLTSSVINFNTENKAAKPKDVIQRCEDYKAALERIETDNSLKMEPSTTAAINEAKSTIAKIKTEAETYISSGQYQIYLDKIHAAEIAKVFLPKAATKNANLESGAITYVKGTEYNDYLKNNLGDSEVASTFRAVTTTTAPYIKKNEYGIPLYQYHEIWVAYKGKDGKCYRCAVYASYTYKGGGTYSSTPTWGADAPEEMACENVMK